MSYREATLWFCNKCGAGKKDNEQPKCCDQDMKNIGKVFEND